MDIAQILLQAGLATQEQLLQAIELQKETGSSLPYIICKLRFAEEVAVAGKIASACGLSCDKLEGFRPDAELLAKFPADFLDKNQILPLSRAGGTLRAGVLQPVGDDLLDQMRMIAGEKVELVVLPPLKAAAVLEQCFGGEAAADDAKVKRPHRHADGRTALNELVQELEGEAEAAPAVVENPDEELYTFETRELLFGLIKALCDQGMVQKEDIIRAAQEL